MLRRLARYASVLAQFGRIRNLRADASSIDELVDAVFSYGHRFFGPMQIREEIIEALREVQALQPRYIVEIGTAGGGTLLLWSRVAHPQATIVTIDLPGGPFGEGSSALRVPLYRLLGLPGQKLHLIRGNSQIPETVTLTCRYLEDHPVDFLFIDADHTASGVRTDYRLYSPLVRPGGIIAFHDIAITDSEYGVKKLWQELSAERPHKAILGSPQTYGIGLLYC